MGRTKRVGIKEISKIIGEYPVRIDEMELHGSYFGREDCDPAFFARCVSNVEAMHYDWICIYGKTKTVIYSISTDVAEFVVYTKTGKEWKATSVHVRSRRQGETDNDER